MRFHFISKDFFTLAIAFCSTLSTLKAASKEETASCVTSKCHATKLEGKSVHSPMKAKGCNVCHKQGVEAKVPEGHPPLKRIPKAEIDTACLTCHDDVVFVNLKFVHAVIKDKTCTACHDPHSSKLPHLLKNAEPPELCFACHEKIKKSFDAMPVKHSPTVTKKSCLNCHEPHASNLKSLLHSSEYQTCMNCHNKEVEGPDHRTIPALETLLKTRAFKHKPVAEGKCTACHDPHGSTQATLLKGSYDKALYATFDPDNYSLCFKCHKESLVTKRNVSEETQFRNGEKNLHFLHVMAKKGRSCRACHEVHAESNPKLIRSTLKYFGLETPIQFQKTETGGSCATACHGTKAYDRNKEVTYDGRR